MKTRHFLLTMLCVFLFSFVPRYCVANQLLALGSSWSSVVTDAFQFKALGNDDASEDIRALALEVCTFLQMQEPEKIQVKQMSPLLRSCVGSKNCIATHNAIFVDQEWLRSLKDDERKFVLAHEAMHIKNKDTAKKIGAYLAMFIVSCAGIAYFKNKECGFVGMGVLSIIELAAFAAFSRYQEARADAGAATISPEAFQGIDDDHSDQSLIQKIWLWLCAWFSEYHQDRFK